MNAKLHLTKENAKLLMAIQDLLDVEWSADTLDEIARLMRANGFQICRDCGTPYMRHNLCGCQYCPSCWLACPHCGGHRRDGKA